MRRTRPASPDVLLEAAITSIMDCEDSVATVDAADKVLAYRNWLGLMRGDLTEEVTKDGVHLHTAPRGRPHLIPHRTVHR